MDGAASVLAWNDAMRPLCNAQMDTEAITSCNMALEGDGAVQDLKAEQLLSRWQNPSPAPRSNRWPLQGGLLTGLINIYSFNLLYRVARLKYLASAPH
jgi:hypothetical protein